MQALAAELAPKTRVNGIAPGFVPTHLAEFLNNSEMVCLPSSLSSIFFSPTLWTVGLQGVSMSPLKIPQSASSSCLSFPSLLQV